MTDKQQNLKLFVKIYIKSNRISLRTLNSSYVAILFVVTTLTKSPETQVIEKKEQTYVTFALKKNEFNKKK